MLEPSLLIIDDINTSERYSIFILHEGIIVSNRMMGTNGSFRTHVYPIVPRADIVIAGTITLGLEVYPYNPKFSMLFEYMGIV